MYYNSYIILYYLYYIMLYCIILHATRVDRVPVGGEAFALALPTGGHAVERCLSGARNAHFGGHKGGRGGSSALSELLFESPGPCGAPLGSCLLAPPRGALAEAPELGGAAGRPRFGRAESRRQPFESARFGGCFGPETLAVGS